MLIIDCLLMFFCLLSFAFINVVILVLALKRGGKLGYEVNACMYSILGQGSNGIRQWTINFVHPQ